MGSLVAWCLTLMVALGWHGSGRDVAEGIVAGAVRAPVFDGKLGVVRTVAVDVVMAARESAFDVGAVGDGGRSRGLFQTPIALPASVEEQTVYANRMLRQSFKACASHPFIERLAWYASGGADGCEREGGQRVSRRRMRMVLRLLERYPAPGG